MTLCPVCGHDSETSYRCEECGKDLVDVDEREDRDVAVTDGGVIPVCPHCDAPRIERRTDAPDGDDSTARWHCRCGADFDEAEYRERKQSRPLPEDSPAGTLAAMDPDAIPDGGLIEVCPDCESSQIYHIGGRYSEHEPQWRCKDCGERFEAAEREPEDPGPIRTDTPAATLEDMDPDAVPDGGANPWVVDCQDCSFRELYEGTRSRLPKEQAEMAIGGHRSHELEHEVDCYPVPERVYFAASTNGGSRALHIRQDCRVLVQATTISSAPASHPPRGELCSHCAADITMDMLADDSDDQPELATDGGQSASGTERFRYVLVGCGGQKRDCRNTLAYNLYTSGWFRWNRAYALWCGDLCSILSAKGVIPWIAYFEPYDLRITDSGFGGEDEPNHENVAAWADDVAAHVDETIHYHSDEDAIEIVVLHAQSYVNPLRDQLADVAADWENVDVTIRYPFDETSGNGEQMRWAREQIAAEKGVDPDDLELNALFCDSCERAARNAEVYPPGEVTSPGNGMAPEWWTADGAWLCESCRDLEKGDAESPAEVETPDPEGHPPDEIQTNLGRWSA